MPYSLQLVQINANAGGLWIANTAWGFPANTNFHTLLMSYWMCGPWYPGPGIPGSPGIWPFFMAAEFFGFGPGTTVGSTTHSVALTNQATGSTGAFFTGDFPNPLPTSPVGCLQHFLMSVDTHAQIVQVYINDQPVTITGPTWGSSSPYNFNIANTINNWAWNVSGVLTTGIHPAMGDAWVSNTPSFVDLSVTANRRRFIAADFTPVDLGATGTLPFGYQPAMYMSVRPGGVPTDILTNRGVGGGTWNYHASAPTFQTDGFCVAIPVPAIGGLALDDIVAINIEPAVLLDTRIFLDWSDNRGRSYRIPVGQNIGKPGAYFTNLQWQRLGYARDRVFRLTWSAPVATALQGAWIDLDAQAKT